MSSRSEAPSGASSGASSGAGLRSLAITGLGSFVGGRTAESWLEAPSAPRVIGIDLQLPRRLEGRISFHRVDLTEPTADSAVAEILEKERCDALLHAAFFSRPHPDREYAHELEVIGSLHVMNAAAATGVRKLVVVSTARVYGAHPDNPAFLSEERELRPLANAHADRDRAEMEGLLALFATRHSRLRVTSLRPCWVMGPSQDSRVSRHLRSDRVTTVMGFDPMLQFLHEDDLLDAVDLALQRPVSGPFNLAGEGLLPLSTLIRLSGKRTLPLPHPLLYRLGYLSSLRRTGDPPAAFYDLLRFGWAVETTRSREVLGFRPQYSTKEAWMSFVVHRRLRRYR